MMGHAMADGSAYLFAALIPYFTETLKMTYFEAGLAWTVLNFVGALPQPFLGAISDRLKTYRLAGIGLIITAVFLGPVGFVGSLAPILVLAVIAGIGVALLHPVGAAFTGAASGDRRGMAMSIFSLGGNIGFAVAPLALPPLILTFGARASAAIVPVGLLVAVPLFVASGRLKQVRRPRPSAGASAPSPGLPLLALSLVVLTSVLRLWVYTSLTTYLPIYLNSRDIPMTTGAQLLALMLASGAVGSIVGGTLSDRFSPKWNTILSHAFATVLFAVFLATTGVASIVALALAGFFLLWSMPVTIVMAQRLMPNNQALASGLTLGLGIGVGGGVGVSVTSWMADVFGIGVAVSSLTVMALLTAVAMLPYREPKPVTSMGIQAGAVGA